MLGMDLDIQGSPRVIDFIDKFKSHLVSSQYYYPLLEQLSHDVLLLPATNNSIEASTVKTALRNSTRQAMLNSLLFMQMYGELTDRLDSQRIISQFVMCHRNRERDIGINF